MMENDMEYEEDVKDTRDDDEDDDIQTSSRASTIVKVMRLERSVKAMQEKLDDVDFQDIENNNLKVQAELSALKKEIDELKNAISNNSQNDIKEQIDELNNKINEAENKPADNNELIVDLNALNIRLEKAEKTLDIVKGKHVDGFAAHVGNWGCRMAFLSFLLGIVCFALKAYFYIGSQNANDDSALQKIKDMSSATDDVLMYVGIFGIFTGVLSLFGFFHGKGKRGKAFMGVLLSLVPVLVWVAFKFIKILEIK